MQMQSDFSLSDICHVTNLLLHELRDSAIQKLHIIRPLTMEAITRMAIYVTYRSIIHNSIGQMRVWIGHSNKIKYFSNPFVAAGRPMKRLNVYIDICHALF